MGAPQPFRYNSYKCTNIFSSSSSGDWPITGLRSLSSAIADYKAFNVFYADFSVVHLNPRYLRSKPKVISSGAKFSLS